MNAARDHEQRADEADEGKVFVQGVPDDRRSVGNYQSVDARDQRAEGHRDVRVIVLPEVLQLRR